VSFSKVIVSDPAILSLIHFRILASTLIFPKSSLSLVIASLAFSKACSKESILSELFLIESSKACLVFPIKVLTSSILLSILTTSSFN
jgi:hypothetical protein